MLGAQETGDVNSQTNDGNGRPAETELLLNQDDNAPAEAADGEAAPLPGVGFGDLVRMILVLALVIGLIYAFVWFLKRFTSQKPESEEIINLISTRPLKGDAALHLVEVGESVFLVGSSSHSVNLVASIDDEDTVNEIRLAASRTPGPVSTSFARMFRERFGSNGPGGSANPVGSQVQQPVSGVEDEATSFLKRQKDRLKDL